jgi:hypothetical protein
MAELSNNIAKTSKSISPHKNNRKSMRYFNLDECESQDIKSLTLSVISSQSDVSVSTQGVPLSPTVPLSGMIRTNLSNIADPNKDHVVEKFFLPPLPKLEENLVMKKHKSMTNKQHFISFLERKESLKDRQAKAEMFLNSLAKELCFLRTIPSSNEIQRKNKANLKRSLRRKRRQTSKNLPN